MFTRIILAAALSSVALTAAPAMADAPATGTQLESYEVAGTVGMDRRQDRRDDRRDDRHDRRDDRQDCRQSEGIGKDKRDCKQAERQQRNMNG